MSVSAIITMSLTMGLVTGFTAYFFYKVLTLPSKKEESQQERAGGASEE